VNTFARFSLHLSFKGVSGMNYRSRHQSGQSVVLLALMLVVIIAMVGLSVDAGNAYAEQRRVQSVANAGALTGMHAVLAPGATNQSVWNEIQRTLVGNGVNPEDPEHRYRVDYILSDETVVMLGEWDGATVRLLVSSNSPPPANIERIQITMTERVGTYFARVVGQDTLPVTANSVACLGDFGSGVYPLGVPVSLKAPTTKIDKNGKVTQTSPGHEEVLPNGQTQPISGSWVPYKTIRIPVDQASYFIPGVHISWLEWDGHTQTVDGVEYKKLGGNGSSDLKAAWIPPGTLQSGFLEGLSGDTSLPNIKPMRQLQIGDWIAGDPGVRATLEDNMRALVNTEIMLPMYDVVSSDKASYHTVNMGKFKIQRVELNGQPKYIDLMYIGNASTVPKGCSSEAHWTSPDDSVPLRTYTISGDTKVDRVWRTLKSSNTTTYDIVIVMDTSGSMDFDWNERRPGTSGYLYPRMKDAKTVLKSFVQQYNISPETGDPDARMAFVTFSGSKNNNDLKIITQANWTKACADQSIPNNCGGDAQKWSAIQTKVD
jgi:hypothetical protein